ncbi:MAG TPA: 1,4-alpha-glucan branching protein GlgB [Gemmatimonadales bacterium]
MTARRDDLAAVAAGDHADPHRVLGVHPAPGGGRLVIRALHPDAVQAEAALPDGTVVPLERAAPGGIFAGSIAGRPLPLRYAVRFRFADGSTWEHGDPYRFPPSLGELDLHLLGEGRHYRLWRHLGAQPRIHEHEPGVAFAVWAPAARRVSVVGDFCAWDGRLFPMRQLGRSGVFELFIPGVAPGALYKYEIKTADGALRLKTDPLAQAMEAPPRTAGRVVASTYEWSDAAWRAARRGVDPRRDPMAIYEVHLGSWARLPEEGNRTLTYREIAPRLVAHARRLGFTHLELLPVAEHAFTGSWGYQVMGYYAPTARYGTPDDFRFFVDYCHQHGLGVILDWVPAHFPKDDFALRRFDGTALYEHEDPRRGEHPEWGTLVFNYGRSEVRNFLIANALYWFSEFHIDGLRVDAVASMLYLDYSRKEGEWLPNAQGGRENLEAVAFLRQLNEAVAADAPECFTVAEESTAWPGVSSAPGEGGLGFTFKWNLGWMHDTLEYFCQDPVHRKFHHDRITFAMLYEYSERFVMPLSHDEVVHGKGSLYSKMPGDPWQRFANLRLLFTYQFTRPGKKLLFMGSELAQDREWNHDTSLDWHLLDDPGDEGRLRTGLLRFLEDLGALYRGYQCLWRTDPDLEGFRWIDCADRDNSVISYERRDGAQHLIVVLNFTPLPRDDYRIGAPVAGRYRLQLSSDAARYGGSDYQVPLTFATEPVPFHARPHSLRLRLPPLAALVLEPEP